MVETPTEVLEAIDRVSTGALFRTRPGIASLTILALGFLIPVLVLLPVWAATMEASSLARGATCSWMRPSTGCSAEP